MPRTFSGSNQYIQTAIGAFASATAFGTMAAIVRITATSRYHGVMGTHTSGGSVTWALEIADDNTLLIGNNAAPAMSSLALTLNKWYIVAAGKNSGTATPRMHRYDMETGTWTHANATSSLANGTTPGASGTWRFGRWQTGDYMAGQIAACAAWSGRNLSDAETELLAGGLGMWMAMAPDGMWLFDQAATTTALSDLTGGGAQQSTISGTTASTDGMPGWTCGDPVVSVHGQTVAVPGFTGWGVPV